MRVISIQRTAEEPLRSRRLKPIDPGREQDIAERHRHRRRHVNRSHAGDQSHRRQPGQSVELTKTEGAVSYARVFVNVFERRKKPKLTRFERPSEGADTILSREGLFWIRLRIVQNIARIESARTKIVAKVSVPL